MKSEFVEANRKRWDESVHIHLQDETGFYRLRAFREGADVLGLIEDREIGDVAGKTLLHLQCHFGLDTLSLARRGAIVTGLDFSRRAIEAARQLAKESELLAQFIESELYQAPQTISEQFDVVYVTWGAINWLDDIARWATIVAGFLRPGGYLYLLEGHPLALTLEQQKDGTLKPEYAYFQGRDPIVSDEEETYTGDRARLENTRAYEWIHPLSDIVNALIGAGLQIDFLNEHDSLPWKLFPCMERMPDGTEQLPEDLPRLPLAFSIRATKG